MASTIKVNNIQNQCGANIANKCGTTITLGASGDTITLACGASQTGFGRTGTVDWDTTAKTASFTAVSGNGYFVNTTSGAITVTLPATPSAGDIVSLADYTNTFQTNSVTVARNGSNIGGVSANATLSTEGQSVTFIYVDATEGWKNVQDSTSNVTGNPFLTATGGTETTCGDFKIHTFTSPGTFTVTNLSSTSAENTVGYLVVAGGGGSGRCRGAGGGGGGYREGRNVPIDNFTASPLVADAPTNAVTVTAQSYPITVGGGGTGGVPGSNDGGVGSNSIFSTIIATGGGGGAGGFGTGGNGGSGGGGSDTGSGGSGNTPPVSPAQGQNGGDSTSGGGGAGSGGGGGATAVGSNGTSSCGGDGGAGATSSINLTPTGRSGGGGGGLDSPGPGSAGSAQDGGGVGIKGPGSGTAGTTNTGGGAGGSGLGSPVGAAGGSGIVIIRYKYQ